MKCLFTSYPNTLNHKEKQQNENNLLHMKRGKTATLLVHCDTSDSLLGLLGSNRLLSDCIVLCLQTLCSSGDVQREKQDRRKRAAGDNQFHPLPPPPPFQTCSSTDTSSPKRMVTQGEGCSLWWLSSFSEELRETEDDFVDGFWMGWFEPWAEGMVNQMDGCPITP